MLPVRQTSFAAYSSSMTAHLIHFFIYHSHGSPALADLRTGNNDSILFKSQDCWQPIHIKLIG